MSVGSPPRLVVRFAPTCDTFRIEDAFRRCVHNAWSEAQYGMSVLPHLTDARGVFVDHPDEMLARTLVKGITNAFREIINGDNLQIAVDDVTDLSALDVEVLERVYVQIGAELDRRKNSP